jgi:hypothetical protein
MSKVRAAHSMSVQICAEGCHLMIVLHDEDGAPFAYGSLDDAGLPGFTKDIHDRVQEMMAALLAQARPSDCAGSA